MARKLYVINETRAKWVVWTLIDAWRRRLPPFDHAEPVPGVLPKTLERGSEQHAVWLMVGLLYMRGRIDSAQAFIRLAKVYELAPEFFEPQNFLNSGFKKIDLLARMQQVLCDNGLGFNIRETVRFWNFNLTKIARHWDGNPLKIFGVAMDYEELCHIFMDGKGDLNNPKGFMGMRHKMVSMFVYFLTKARLIGPFVHPGPVDTHNIRVFASTEVIVPIGGTRPGSKFEFYDVSPTGRQVYEKHCFTVEDVLDLADALWYLSRDFCSLSQGNSSHAGKYRARDTEIRPKVVKWTKERVEVYGRTCGVCPVESVCKWSLPSAKQYNQGVLEVRGQRPKPHQEQMKLPLGVAKNISPRPPKPKKRELPVFDRPLNLFD